MYTLEMKTPVHVTFADFVVSAVRHMIDWEKLGDLEDWNRAWNSTLDSGLSERYVPGEGDNPKVMLIGEAPGAQEDIALRPFVGASGRVLRDLMASCGLYTGETPHFGTANCWLTNVVHFRPPRNRNPLPSEITVARSGLKEEWIAIGKPRIIIPVGGIALKAILGKENSITMMSGKCTRRRSRTDGKWVYIWPMLHPSYIMRQKSLISVAENDWDKFDEWLKRTEKVI